MFKVGYNAIRDFGVFPIASEWMVGCIWYCCWLITHESDLFVRLQTVFDNDLVSCLLPTRSAPTCCTYTSVVLGLHKKTSQKKTPSKCSTSVHYNIWDVCCWFYFVVVLRTSFSLSSKLFSWKVGLKERPPANLFCANVPAWRVKSNVRLHLRDFLFIIIFQQYSTLERKRRKLVIHIIPFCLLCFTWESSGSHFPPIVSHLSVSHV